jgi:hypothetical protein
MSIWADIPKTLSWSNLKHPHFVCFCPKYGLVLWGEETLTDKLLLALEITVMISGNCEMCALSVLHG